MAAAAVFGRRVGVCGGIMSVRDMCLTPHGLQEVEGRLLRDSGTSWSKVGAPDARRSDEGCAPITKEIEHAELRLRGDCGGGELRRGAFSADEWK